MKNKRSTQAKPSIIIDTTFLLPALGISVEEEAEEVIPLFRKLNVYYLEVGLLEAMWKIIKIIPIDKLERVRLGLEAIRRTYSLLSPSAKALVEALLIYRKGHRDYIDALHYTAAKDTGIPLLTIDYEFIEFLVEHGYETRGVVLIPKELKKWLKD